MISEIRRDGKLRHARLILEQIKNLFQESPLEQDVQVQCSDGVVQTHCLILASISPTMKDYLHEVECSTIKEPLVILPDISKSEVTKFLDHILDQSAPDQKDSCDIKAACLALGVNPIPFEDVTEDRIKQVEENAEINDDHEIDDNSEATKLLPKPSPTKGRRKVRVVVSESPIGKKKEPRILSYSSFGRARKPTAKLESDDGSSSSNLSDDDSEEYDPDNRDLKISLEVKEPIRTTNKPFERQVVGSGSLKCDFCPRTYHHVKAKNKHMLLDHKAACRSRGMYFPCKRCDMIFTSVTGRDKHVVRIHSNDLLEDSDPSAATAEQIPDLDWIKCPFSHPSGEDFFVLNVKEMRKHLKQVHPDKDNHCFVCGESCGSKKNLEQHIQAHQGAEGKILFGCEHCCQKFLSEYALIAHKRDSHSTAETVTCKYCEKPFRNLKFCRNHEAKHLTTRESTHPTEFRCLTNLADGTECGKTYTQKANLERHERSHMGNNKSFRCQECGKMFVDSTRLKHHRWIHSGHFPYKCKDCDKGFRHISHLKTHRVLTHGEEKDFQCPSCPKRFVYAYQLRSHEASHKRKQASEKDIVPSNEHREIVLGLSSDNQPGSEIIQTFYQCSLCQEMFDSYLSLEAHCAVHAGGEEGTVVLAVDESLHAENTITYLSNEGETTTLATRNAADLLNPQDEIVLKVHDEITAAEDGTQKVHVQTEGDDGQQYVLVLEQNPSENEGEFLTGIVPQILTKMREDR